MSDSPSNDVRIQHVKRLQLSYDKKEFISRKDHLIDVYILG